MAEFIKVAKASELAPGECKVVQANGTDLALYNVGGAFYATTNVCPHRGGPLGEGLLEGAIVTCPWHGWQFDVTQGCLANNPLVKVQTFPAKVDGDDVTVQV